MSLSAVAPIMPPPRDNASLLEGAYTTGSHSDGVLLMFCFAGVLRQYECSCLSACFHFLFHFGLCEDTCPSNCNESGAEEYQTEKDDGI